MSHVSSNLVALQGAQAGLTDPLLYHVTSTQESMGLVPGDGVVLCRAIKPLTISLPRANTCRGRAFHIIKVDSSDNPVTVTCQDLHELIFSTAFARNGVRRIPIAEPLGSKVFLSDGRSWVVSQYNGFTEYPGFVPDGGTTGQVLAKASDADYDTQWIDPPTGPTGALAYRHVQATAAMTWSITHNLSFRPNVAVVDSTGREIWPGDVNYPSDVAVTLTFSAAVGGEAYLS